MAETKREYWTPQEDAKLMEYVNADGTADWNMAAKSFVNEEGNVRKTGSSCYQRYKNHLAPGLVHGDFTDQETDETKRLLALHGKKWAFIASQLPGRTGNAVKNWYHKREDKKARELKQALAAAPAGGPTIGGNLYDGDGPGVDVSNWGDGEGGDRFGGNINQQFLNNGTGYNQPLVASTSDSGLLGDYNHQFANSGGAGFEQYNHQIVNSSGGAGFGDYNHQLANSGGAGFGHYNHQFANSGGAGFGDYNQQLAGGAGFGDYNQPLVNSVGDSTSAGGVFGDYNHQFANSGGAGFGQYNHQIVNSSGGAGFGDYNHQIGDAGFVDYNHQFANSGAGYGVYDQQLAGAGFGGSYQPLVNSVGDSTSAGGVFGDYSHQFANSGGGGGAGFGHYNHQIGGSGFGDYNQQFANCGGAGFGDYNQQFDDDLLWDFNEQKFINNNGGG